MEHSDIALSHHSNPQVTTHTAAAMLGATGPDISQSPLSTILPHANEEKVAYHDTSCIRKGFGGVALTQIGSQVARVGERKPYTTGLNYRIDSEAWKDVDRTAMKHLKEEHSSIVGPDKQNESKRTASVQCSWCEFVVLTTWSGRRIWSNRWQCHTRNRNSKSESSFW
jgi:hypothetical protein